jgi:hypothetical protein
MKHFLSALLCALAFAAAQGAEVATSLPPAAANANNNRTFASSIEAAQIPRNVTFMTAILDGLGEWAPRMPHVPHHAVHACAGSYGRAMWMRCNE